MNKHIELLIRFDAGEVPPQAFVDWAICQLKEDRDGNELNELAWLKNPDYSEARKLFIRSVVEIGEAFPSVPEQKMLLAKRIGGNIISGMKDPNEGCTEIAEISRNLKSPDLLSIFEILSHEQYNHEHLGMTAENTKPSILEEANKLADAT